MKLKRSLKGSDCFLRFFSNWLVIIEQDFVILFVPFLERVSHDISGFSKVATHFPQRRKRGFMWS